MKKKNVYFVAPAAAATATTATTTTSAMKITTSSHITLHWYAVDAYTIRTVLSLFPPNKRVQIVLNRLFTWKCKIKKFHKLKMKEAEFIASGRLRSN